MNLSRHLKWFVCVWLLLIVTTVLLHLQRGMLADSTRHLPESPRIPERRANPDQRGGFVRKQSRLHDSFDLWQDRLSRDIAAIEQEHDDLERERMMHDWVEGINLADIPAALKLLEQHDPGEICQKLTVRLIRRWAETNPSVAAAWAQKMVPGGARSEALNAVAIAWANVGISDAVQWAKQLPEGQDRQGGLTSIAYEAARSNPIEAMRLAVELPANQIRDDLINHTAAQWASGAPEVAMQWAQQIPDQQLRERVLGQIATVWGDENPFKAASLALTLPPGKTQEDAVMGIVERWVQKEPAAAAAWVEQFPDGNLRQTAMEEITKLWPKHDLQTPRQ